MEQGLAAEGPVRGGLLISQLTVHQRRSSHHDPCLLRLVSIPFEVFVVANHSS
jgi:hypothetical protein